MTKKTETPDRPAFPLLLRPDEFITGRREWLAEDALAANSPAVIAGGRVEMTWAACDMAVSLATGTPFLGCFRVPRRRRVAYCCYQTPFGVVRDILKAVATARGVELGNSELRLPRAEPAFRTRQEWKNTVSEMQGDGVEVVILDPVTCALRSGELGETATQVERLPAIGDAFLAAAITPVFGYGTTWRVGFPRFADLGALRLRDYARQWLLLGRCGATTPSPSGRFRLVAGGFDRHEAKYTMSTRAGYLGVGAQAALAWHAEVTKTEAEARTTAGSTMHNFTTELLAETEEAMISNRGKRLTGRSTKVTGSAWPPTTVRGTGPTLLSFEPGTCEE